ncbi:MAG: ABC transporter permease [Candidatus Pacebacteria bacterium]|nr:ABC transporter permease [Candidatus Paceibacterota bacterium]
MIFNEYLKIAIKNLRTRQLRSWLTILGIVIGVFLIMSLLSLSQGLKNTVLKQLSAMGTDIIMVMPGSLSDFMTTMMGGVELTNSDLQAIEKTKGVEAVIPMAYKGESVKYESENKIAILYGMDIKNSLSIYKEDMGMDVKEGRWLLPGKREIVVGSLVPLDVFPGLKVGKVATIKGKQFEIVGILKSLGNRQDDSMIGIDLDIFRSITGEKDGAPQAVVKIAAGFSVDQVAKDIKKNLEENAKRRAGQEENAYSVLTSDALSGIVGNVMAILQIAIFSFASIAIIVGGIGIMNTMYTSVRERTKEIGILKAVGAKNSTIIMIFLMEAGIIGLIGGLGGMIFGLGLAKSVEFIGKMNPSFYIQASITPGLIIFGFAFSFGVGCLSGFFPARSAAKLKPVEALRYE